MIKSKDFFLISRALSKVCDGRAQKRAELSDANVSDERKLLIGPEKGNDDQE